MLSKPEAFFAHVRSSVFGGQISQQQVNGINAILDAWDRYGDGNLQRLAYVLATPNVETGGRYQPIYEIGPKAYFAKYEPGTKLGKQLGNTEPGDGYKFRGAGLVQQTGRGNAIRTGAKLGLDLVNHPELMMDLATSARILVVGTMEGWFTGKGLDDFIDDVDEDDAADLAEFIQARRTVNGQDKAAVIGRDALRFEAALKAGGYNPTGTAIPDREPQAPPISPIPVTRRPVPANGRRGVNIWAIGAVVAALALVAAAFFLPIFK